MYQLRIIFSGLIKRLVRVVTKATSYELRYLSKLWGCTEVIYETPVFQSKELRTELFHVILFHHDTLTIRGNIG